MLALRLGASCLLCCCLAKKTTVDVTPDGFFQRYQHWFIVWCLSNIKIHYMLHVVQFNHIILVEQPLQQTKTWRIFGTLDKSTDFPWPSRFLLTTFASAITVLDHRPLARNILGCLGNISLEKKHHTHFFWAKTHQKNIQKNTKIQKNPNENTKVMRTWNSLATPWCVYLELPCDSLKTTSETCTVKLGICNGGNGFIRGSGVFIRIWMKDNEGSCRRVCLIYEYNYKKNTDKQLVFAFDF